MTYTVSGGALNSTQTKPNFGPTQVSNPNSVSIGSFIFVQLKVVSNRQICIGRPHYICCNRPYLSTLCMQCCLKWGGGEFGLGCHLWWFAMVQLRNYAPPLGQLSLASLWGRLIEYQLRLG